jgi:hypothetical protein
MHAIHHLTRRRALLLGVLAGVASALVVATADVEADFRRGLYTGKTDAGDAIRFNAARTQLTGARVTVRYLCDDGDGFRVPETFPAIRVAKDKFDRSFDDGAGGTYTITGRLVGRRASGTVRADRRFNASNQPDPAGSIRCYAYAKWRARR